MQVLSCSHNAVQIAHIGRPVSRAEAVVSVNRPHRCRGRRRVAVAASMEEEAHRNTVKNLTRLFYGPTTSQQADSSQQDARCPRLLKGSHITNLPLWRVEWAVVPGMQSILHVLAPHYVHAFETVFSQPRPWVFGHLYLPGGSKNLGAPTHALASGSKAPLVGVLMQVTRAVRLRDGKFLLLATALGRFKVVRCLRELPYSEADVQLYEDCEHLEGLSATATAAVLQAACADVSVSALMSASTAAAREAAAALHWSWLRGYELKVAAGQDWPGPGPREGESDMETYHLVQELAAQGVADVLPLPDGVVIGRCNLQQVATDATAAMQQALAEVATQLTGTSSSSSSQADSSSLGSQQLLGASAADADGQKDVDSSSSSSSRSGGTGSLESLLSSSEGDHQLAAIGSLNTVGERGVALQGPEVCELTGRMSCGSTEDVLMLEAAVWQQLDILAALSTRVKGRRHSLPFGLLQLRPPRPQLSVAAATILANQAAAAAEGGKQQVLDANINHQRASNSSSGSSSSGLPQGPDVVHPPVAEVVSDTDDEDSVVSSSDSSSSTASSQVPLQSPDMQHRAQTSSAASSSSDDASGGSLSSRSAAAAADPGRQWSSASQYAFAASEGMDVHADPLWPPLRRAAKLSWAAALVTGEFDLDKGPHTSDLRQALLETPSIASRLRYVLAVLQKHARVLAALAAVKDVQE